ncbi:hypothetical protein NDU88_000490 [Pleurodeles waltl]|uniref:Uncharacterized protein n=1 Tax=Pleurodeles waltl TaxID=8319 RepID=A0AAV7P550_PLEWA|nr:hypothetical protein NDU88_000488 [Pleurodeles waltl]KAJ1121984.1 hypothetical protein NDU88_000490 [Pleurodeles waltl]
MMSRGLASLGGLGRSMTGSLGCPEGECVWRRQAGRASGDLDRGLALAHLCAFARPTLLYRLLSSLMWRGVQRLFRKRRDDADRPHSIIACLLRHVQTHQLLQAAREHSPFRLDDLEVRLTPDFSKETSKRRRAFLATQPRLRKLDVKYGFFEPARMWITKNGVSRDFYDPEDLQVFLEGLQNQTQSMDTASSIWTQDPLGPLQSVALSAPTPEDMGQTTAGSHPRGRDLERLTNSHDDRGQVVQAVAMHNQIAASDKSCSPLKPTLTPT